MNKEIIQHLNKISDYYTVAGDPTRSFSFKKASKIIETLNINIAEALSKGMELKGLGKSTISIINQFQKEGTSERLLSLQEEHPPIELFNLLELYDFDIEYLKYLWSKYKITSVQDLSQINEPRVVEALSNLYNVVPHVEQFPEVDIPLLGDCAVQTSFGMGYYSIDDLVSRLVEMKDKHVFIADTLQSPNILGGMREDFLDLQRREIKQAQLDHNVRVFHGVVLDVDIDGNFYQDVLDQVEFVILKLSTRPHTDIIKRLTKAVSGIKNKKTIIDCIDIYSHLTINKEDLQSLLIETNSSLLVSGKDPLERTSIYNFLKGSSVSISLASQAQTESDFDTLIENAKVVGKLGIPHKSIMNCLPRPLGSALVQSKNTVGVKSKSNSSLSRIEKALDKINELRKSGNSLGSLIEKRKRSGKD